MILFFALMVALSKILQVAIWILTHKDLPRNGKFITFIILSFITVATIVSFIVAVVIILENFFAQGL